MLYVWIFNIWSVAQVYSREGRKKKKKKSLVKQVGNCFEENLSNQNLKSNLTIIKNRSLRPFAKYTE